MGLTKPRAAQIYNLDYKQSTRVVTVANVTLSGGAPAQVDGVSLSLNDRVLVTGQSTGSQNGLYYVTTVGSGNNGTWARTTDGNETGEIEAGMIVMVTEGTIYADTQWKLTTNDPITIGSTALTFTQNYSANSISAGTSNVAVYSNANVTISSAGTPNVLTISSTGTITSGTASVAGNITGSNILTSGVVTATGNVFANYFIGNGACLTGVVTSLANINNGNSNVTVIANSNVTVGIGGTSNVAVFATTGEYITGVLSASGNVTGGNVTTAGIVTATGNVTGGNVLTAGVVSATGNVTGNYILGNGALLTGVANINNGTSNVTVVSSGGNVTVGIGGTGNVAVFSTSGLDVTGRVSATGNVTGGNLITAGLASITGNVNIGNATGVTWANATGVRAWTYYNNTTLSVDTVFL